MIRYGAAFVMCTLLHVFGRAGVGTRDIGVEKQKEKDLKTKEALLQAIRGGGRRRGRGGQVSSSDGDGGERGGESSDDNGSSEGGGRGRDNKRLPQIHPNLPSSLMHALTIPPPSPLSMTLDEFTKEYLLKFPPAPKSYEVTADDCTRHFVLLPSHSPQVTIGSKVRRISKQVFPPNNFFLAR